MPEGDLTPQSHEPSRFGVREEPARPVADEEIPAPTAHYGFLVVSGMLFMLASIAASVLLACLKLFPWLYDPSRELVDCWIPALVTGLPLLGILFFLMVCRIGWLDGHAHRLAALVNARVYRMPPLEGSDLPFILPWTVSGGLAIIVPLALLLLGDERAPQAAFAIPVGVLLFALGLGLGELRRFLARMSWACDRVTLAQPRQEAPVAVLLRMGLELLTPCTMVATALLAGVLSAAGLGDAIGRDEDILICLFSALLIATMGGAYSLYRVSKRMAYVVAKGERLARLLNLNRLGLPYSHRHRAGAFLVALLPILWIWCLLVGRVVNWDFFFVSDRWIADLPGLDRWTGLVLMAAMLAGTLWMSGVWLLLHRAFCSLEAIVESSVPPRDAWTPSVFLPRTVAAFCATLLLLLSLALLCITLMETFLPGALAIAVLGWGLLVFLISQSTDLVETRVVCVVLTLPALAVLMSLAWIPQAPQFMLVTGGSLFAFGFSYAVLSVESLAARIERTRKALAETAEAEDAVAG